MRIGLFFEVTVDPSETTALALLILVVSMALRLGIVHSIFKNTSQNGASIVNVTLIFLLQSQNSV
jgi:hypothetical protein